MNIVTDLLGSLVALSAKDEVLGTIRGLFVFGERAYAIVETKTGALKDLPLYYLSVVRQTAKT